MGKKYYFRGLGLGIIVTALIMGIALSRDTKREMTDAEVIARAKKLGMIENSTLLEPSDTDEKQGEAEPSAEKETEKEPVKKDAAAKPKDNAVDPTKAAGEKASQEQPAEQAENEPQEMPAKQEETTSQKTTENQKPAADTNEMTKQDEDTALKAPPDESPSEEDSKQEEISITIVSGDGSYTVAKKLEEAGAVISASAYDDYLCQNGYDKRLRTGTFRIPAGASDEQIARIVSNQP